MKKQDLSDEEREFKEWKKNRFKSRCYIALSFAPLLLALIVEYVPGDVFWLIAVVLSIAVIRSEAVGGENAEGICSITALALAFLGSSNLYPHSEVDKSYVYDGMLMMIVGIGYLILLVKYIKKNKE